MVNLRLVVAYVLRRQGLKSSLNVLVPPLLVDVNRRRELRKSTHSLRRLVSFLASVRFGPNQDWVSVCDFFDFN